MWCHLQPSCQATWNRSNSINHYVGMLIIIMSHCNSITRIISPISSSEFLYCWCLHICIFHFCLSLSCLIRYWWSMWTKKIHCLWICLDASWYPAVLLWLQNMSTEYYWWLFCMLGYISNVPWNYFPSSSWCLVLVWPKNVY